MGLTNVLNAASTGLHITQLGLDVVARNIANADTPGYTRKTLSQASLTVAGNTIGVRELGVERHVDQFLLHQLRVESSAASNVNVRHQFLQRLDSLFGAPGSDSALDTRFNFFSESLQQLTTAPEDYPTRQDVLTKAQVLAESLREMSAEIQNLRQLAEDSVAVAVEELNTALSQLKTINEQLSISGVGNNPPADLLDERDKLLSHISQFLEIRINEKPSGAVNVVTAGGNSLLDGEPVGLVFDARGDLTAASQYSPDPAIRDVGTLKLLGTGNYEVDLIRNGSLTSGSIGAYLELRDHTLVEAQAQLDEFAAGLAQALSDKTVSASPVVAGAAEGFEADLTGLQPGNAITLKYTPTPPGTEQTVTIIRVDDASQLPLGNDATSDPNDTVIGIDFSGGFAAAAAAIDTALGASVAVSNPSGGVLRFLDDGAAGTSDINALSATVTSTSVQDDGLQLPLFVDGYNTPYTGSLDGGPQKTGFAGRISVNPLITQNNELLVRHSTGPETPIGDPDRPFELLSRISEATRDFAPHSGIGVPGSPFNATLSSFATRIISFQTGQAATVAGEKASQDLVVSAFNDRVQDQAGVDVDGELSQLMVLQNAFAANARVMQAAEEMLRVLMQM